MPRMPVELDRESPSKAIHGAGKELGGFKKFILRGNVVDLAVGVVIGAAFTGVVQAFVRDVITPLIGLFAGNRDFSNLVLTVGAARFPIGDLVNAIRAEKMLAVGAGDNVVRLLPPLIVSEEEIAEGVARLDRACARLSGTINRQAAAPRRKEEAAR